MTNFHALGLAEPIIRALAEERYDTPTPIQSQAIPPALAGRDLIGIAQTGTGKTAAFALPILNRLAASPARPRPKSVRVLILAPTRELGGQIVDSFHAYGRHVRIKTTLAIGGVPIGKQMRALANGVDVLVATPGRLLDLHNNRAVNLGEIEVFVLDEADRMLDMGFIRDIRKIVALVPKVRQTLFFSATMPPEIARLADDMLSNPVTVAVTPSATTVELIEQSAIRVDKAGKPGALAGILASEAVDRALVFTRTKHGADRVVRALIQAGIPAEAIHGNKTQGNRERTMAAFRSGNIRTLVATDIAARGIDVDGISHVINYDLPNIAETYVHRIGRTARAGATGIAISLISADEMPFLRAIERLIRRTVPMAGGGNRDSITEKAEATREHRRGDNRGRGNRRPERNDDRPARHADGGQPNRGKHRGGGKGRPQGEQHHGNGNAGNGNGGNRHRDGGNRQPDNRPSKGSNGGIAEVGFMGRPRRSGGMSQGPA